MKAALIVLSFLIGTGAAFGGGSRGNAAAAVPQQIDLPTAIRLAGARNLNVKLASEKVTLARAEQIGALQQFFPWISVGTQFRGHDGNTQTVDGQIIDAHKSALDFGAAVKAQVEIGEAYFRNLAAKQLVKAAVFASEAQGQDAVLTAATGYLELLRAESYVSVTAESVRISADYEAQVKRAVEAGIAFAGDAYRIQTQTEMNRLQQRQALENRRVAAAQLADILHLDPSVDLLPSDPAPVPLNITSASASLDSFVQRALIDRPELHMTAAQREAARRSRDGAKYGPLVPALGGQYFYGGLGGGRGNDLSDFDESEDYSVGLSWRIGPGGLFDRSRIDIAESRLRTAELETQKLRDAISRQVVESHTRLRSLSDQLATARRVLAAAQKTLELSRERKEFGVGAVAETIQAEQDLTRARRDYFGIVTEYNKAEFVLQRAVGSKH